MKKLIFGIALAALLPSAVNAKDVCFQRVYYVNPPSDMTIRPELTSYAKFKIVPVPKNGAVNLVGVSYWGSYWGGSQTGMTEGVALGMTDGTISYRLNAQSFFPGDSDMQIYVANANKKTFVGTIIDPDNNTSWGLSFIDCSEYPMPILTPVILP